MASWSVNPGGTRGGYYTVTVESHEIQLDAANNRSLIELTLTANNTNTAYQYYDPTGGANYQGYVNGGLVVNNSWTYDYRYQSNYTLINGNQYWISHDANGNATVSVSGAVNFNNSPYLTTASTGGSYTLTRLPLAPTPVAITVDSITTNSARLGGEIANYGHGTSATWEMFYRKQGSSTWISLGQQADASGYNYWTVTGLNSATNYEYYANVWNNNGTGVPGNADTTTFSTQTFTTLVNNSMAVIDPF